MTDEMQSEDAMVVTRRGKVTGAATPRLTKSESSYSENDTIAVRVPDRYHNGSGLSEAKPSKSGVDIAQCTSVREQDPAVTAAPSTTERSQDKISSAAENIKSSNPYPEPDLFKVEPNQRLIGDIEGGMGNPIVLTDSPPRRQPNNPSMHAQQIIPRAHGQLGRPYKKPFTITSSGPIPIPKPTYAGVLNGHQSHDIYQMMRAQNIAAYQNQRNSAPVPVPIMQPMPYQVRYPMSANFMAQPRTIANDPFILYNSIFGLSVSKNSPFTITPPDEEVLRRKAMQHIREYQRPNPRKRSLSHVDPDETSVSSFEDDAPAVAKTSATKSSKPLLNRTITSPTYSHSVRPLQRQGTKPPPVHHQQRRQEEAEDSNFGVSHLFDQSIILASMLQMYPNSKDKKGFRDEIAMLATVHNEQMITWRNDEINAEARKRRKANAGTDAAPTRPTGAGQGNEKTTNQDNEMREVLSAKSGMWQEGEQQNLADVFAVGPSSSPANGDYVQLGGPVGVESGIRRENGMRWVGAWKGNTDAKTFAPGAGRRGADDDDDEDEHKDGCTF